MDALIPILATFAAAALSGALGYFLGYSRGRDSARLPPLERTPVPTVKRPVGPRRID